MSKELKVWNGRGWGGRRYDEAGKHVYDPTGIKWCDHAMVCAHSRAEAVRIINQAAGHNMVSNNELKKYWSPCWGNDMDGITPELGVWTVQDYGHKPIRIWPR